MRQELPQGVPGESQLLAPEVKGTCGKVRSASLRCANGAFSFFAKTRRYSLAISVRTVDSSLAVGYPSHTLYH